MGGHCSAGVSCFLAGDILALLWRVTVTSLPEMITTLILDGEGIVFVFELATGFALLRDIFFRSSLVST